MILTRILSRPVMRPRLIAEVGLAVLLAAQVPLWLVALNASHDGNPAPPIRISASDARVIVGVDPFFRGADGGPDPLPDFTLFAVRTGGDAGAILAGPDGIQKAVRPGDAVSEGVVLAEVGEDHVILAHGRARTRLEFPPAPPPSFAPPPAQPSLSTGTRSPEGSADATTYETALRPVQSQGVVEGYAWRPGTEGGILAAAGLRPGDVLLRINGTPFDRHERFGELAADIAAGRAVQIDYKRNGSEYSATYSPD